MTAITKTNHSLPPNTKLWNLIGISLGVFAMGIEYYIASLALPSIIEEFDSGYVTTQWIVIIYSLVLAVSVLGMSSLGDLYDKKKLYLFGVILFTLSSLLCGFAISINTLILFRGFQAFGAVFLLGLRASIISEIFPKTEWGYAQGIVSGASGVGIAFGPGLGGLILSLGDWRWLFWMNVPIGIIVFIILFLSMPDLEPQNSRGSFDFWGSAILGICLLCLMGSLILLETVGTNYILTLLLLIASLIIFLFFLYWESRQDNPILDLGLFQTLDVSINLLIFLIIYIIFGSMQLILPIFLEIVCYHSPQTVGLTMANLATISIFIAPIVGISSDRFGSRKINIIGLILIMIGAILASTLHIDTTITGFLVKVIWLEIGITIFVPPTVNLIMGSIPPEKSGTVSGLIALSRSLGLSFGTSLFGLLIPLLINIKKQGINTNVLENSFPLDFAKFSSLELSIGIDQIFLLSVLISCFSIVAVTYLWIKKTHGNNEVDLDPENSLNSE